MRNKPFLPCNRVSTEVVLLIISHEVKIVNPAPEMVLRAFWLLKKICCCLGCRMQPMGTIRGEHRFTNLIWAVEKYCVSSLKTNFFDELPPTKWSV